MNGNLDQQMARLLRRQRFVFLMLRLALMMLGIVLRLWERVGRKSPGIRPT